MSDFFKNLQQKPKHIRMRIFIAVMVVAALALFSLWLYLSVGSVSDGLKDKNGLVIEDIDLPTISDSVSANLKDIFNVEDKK